MAEEEEKEETASPGEEKPEEGSEAPEEAEGEEADVVAEGEEADEEKIPMTVSVEEEGHCRKKVKIEIPPDRVTKDIQEGLKDIRTSVPMPGFRKGRAPTALLARRFGKKVREE
ncbi:MAG: trigger factor family protein, partial [Planctomycetota bacterium]